MEDHVDDAAAASSASTRVRASERAITAALNAIIAAGLPVEKLCISGGKVEIHVTGVEGASAPKKHKGPKDW
ncbi:MAG TPA: hypothetical protein VK181_23265 [Rhizobium sp.]|nr:hypothetical protein [Rhizobium sp.]